MADGFHAKPCTPTLGLFRYPFAQQALRQWVDGQMYFFKISLLTR